MLPEENKARLITQSCWESYYVRYASIIEPGGQPNFVIVNKWNSSRYISSL